MPRNEKTHGGCLAALRAFAKTDPLLREVDVEMVAHAALFVACLFVFALAAKGWAVTWA